MCKVLYAVYGASGFGREVMPIAREFVKLNGGDTLSDLFFIDDDPVSEFVNGHKVVTFDEFLNIDSRERFVSLAIANSSIREKLAKKCVSNGIILWSLSASNVVVFDDVKVGKGAILSPFVTLTSNIQIGDYFQANIYSYVGHDCIIGDFVTFAPGVKCNGNVVIEDHVYIGTGAIIKQGKPGKPLVINENAVIAAGAVVTKNVPAGVTVFGNPAALLSKENLRNKQS